MATSKTPRDYDAELNDLLLQATALNPQAETPALVDCSQSTVGLPAIKIVTTVPEVPTDADS